MKKKIIWALVPLITGYFVLNTCKAQAPQGIPYQAIARNASGVAIAGTAIKVRFSIRDSIANGAIKYQETHNPTTSALGLFSVNVGMGTVVSGTFSGINWGKNAKFLQVEMDPAGGTTYTDLGTTQMMSVPYALYSGRTNYRISSLGDSLILGESQVVIIPGISTSNNQNIGTKVIDVEGNSYSTIKIGNQVWLKENLRVTKFQNGDPIQFVTTNFYSVTSPAYTRYSSNQEILKLYGLGYNAICVSDPRGLCPIGYRVPNNSDWTQLVINLRNNGYGIGGVNNQGIGKSITVDNWNYSDIFGSPGNNNLLEFQNKSGFSALPAGSYDTGSLGKWARFWSTDNFGNGNYYGTYISFDSPDAILGTDGNLNGGGSYNQPWSVRCLKN